jgi:hypothetical protein
MAEGAGNGQGTVKARGRIGNSDEFNCVGRKGAASFAHPSAVSLQRNSGPFI